MTLLVSDLAPWSPEMVFDMPGICTMVFSILVRRLSLTEGESGTVSALVLACPTGTSKGWGITVLVRPIIPIEGRFVRS
jgi:hypothetical protein